MFNRDSGPLLQWSEAARALGVTERQVRHLWSTGRLGGVHVGRHVRFRPGDIADFIDAHSVPPTPAAHSVPGTDSGDLKDQPQ